MSNHCCNPVAQSINYVKQTVHESNNSIDCLCSHVGILRHDCYSHCSSIQSQAQNINSMYQNQQHEIHQLKSLVTELHANQQAEIQSLKIHISDQNDQISDLKSQCTKQAIELDTFKDEFLFHNPILSVNETSDHDLDLLERSYDSVMHKIKILEQNFNLKYPSQSQDSEPQFVKHADFSAEISSDFEDDVFYDAMCDDFDQTDNTSVSDCECDDDQNEFDDLNIKGLFQ